MNRRTFIAMTTASAIATQRLTAKTISFPSPIETTDHFWQSIRGEFPITRELLYMNNGTMGPSPRRVTERLVQRIEYVDRTGDYAVDMEGVPRAVARVIGAESGDNIAFTHNV